MQVEKIHRAYLTWLKRVSGKIVEVGFVCLNLLHLITKQAKTREWNKYISVDGFMYFMVKTFLYKCLNIRIKYFLF